MDQLPLADRKLAGRKIVITRTRAQAGSLRVKLKELGAEAVEIPTIAIVDPEDGGAALASAVGKLGNYAWVVVTSPNGAERVIDAMDARGLLGAPRFAAVGTATARELTRNGFMVDLIPERQVAEGLLAVFPHVADAESPDGATQLLLAQADAARPVLAEGLRELGWEVDQVVAYRTVDAAISDEQRVAARGSDIVTFTSSSTVDRFCDRVGIENLPSIVACIGPITAATARARGLTVDVEADDHSIDGLVQALVAFVHSSP